MAILAGNTALAEDFINESEIPSPQSDAVGKVPKLESDGKISSAFLGVEFGDGSDGDVTISSPTTLTRDMYYDNLTVNDTLTTAGFVIYVKGTLTGTGTIKYVDGSNGGNGSSNGVVGTGGASASVAGQFKNIAGVNGGASIDGAGSNGNSSNPSQGVAGTSGGNGRGGAVGGTGGTTGIKKRLGNRFLTVSGLDLLDNGTFAYIKGSASGGGGGAGETTGGGSPTFAGGGGSGASGGVVVIIAKTITGTLTFMAKGGNGGNGANQTGQSISGGGAGGSGGVVIVIYNTISGVTYNVAGGTGGTAGGTGATAGADGNTGLIFERKLISLY